MKNQKKKGQKIRKKTLEFQKEKKKQHTLVLSLLTRASKPSLDTFAGKLTAGASDLPSSSETNWTITFGVGLGASGSGSGTPWYTFWRFGGGRRVAIGFMSKNIKKSSMLPDKIKKTASSCLAKFLRSNRFETWRHSTFGLTGTIPAQYRYSSGRIPGWS